MPIHTITPEEKARLTDSACHLFLARNPDFWPCAANSERLIQFVHQQLGQTLDEHPFPVLVDSWQAAYDYLRQHSWFYTRPEEVEVGDPAVTREKAVQQKVRDDHATRVEADKIGRDRAMPISQLGAKVSQQNAEFREQRERNELPTRTPGLESRPLSTVTLGLQATARANVALANPSLPRDSAAFAKLYAAELSRLRS